MRGIGFVVGVAAGLVCLGGIAQASAATVLYTVTGDNPIVGGELALSFTSSDFLVLPTGTDTLIIPGVTTCVVESAPCLGSPTIVSRQPSADYLVVRLPAADGTVSSDFDRPDFSAFGTYASSSGNGVTMTVSGMAAPEASTSTMLGLGLIGLAAFATLGGRTRRRGAMAAV